MGVRRLSRQAVFLDRDGVLNRAIVREGKPYPPASLEELQIMPGALEACRNLRKSDFLLIMVTNQPDVARGSQRREVVEALNQSVSAHLCLDAIKVCYHDDSDGCKCRKPKPGMLLQAAREWNVDLTRSFMIGDRGNDVEAGRRAGCSTILIQSAYSDPGAIAFDKLVSSLSDAADWILNRCPAKETKNDKHC